MTSREKNEKTLSSDALSPKKGKTPLKLRSNDLSLQRGKVSKKPKLGNNIQNQVVPWFRGGD